MAKRNKSKMLEAKISGVDEPLLNPYDDCLDRANFAKRIFTLIDKTPLDTHLRVGIFGDWGSGKTTAMNFVKYYCCEKGHPVAAFHPWQFHSREDAWKGLITSLDKGLSAWSDAPIGNFKRKRIVKAVSTKARDLAEIADSKIGKAIAKLILSPLENLLEETKANVSRDLKQMLGDKRLYVFVDDLDRAEPEIVYDMLMLLNEIFDISQCIFIIGLDTKTVSEVLKNKLGYMKSKDFLDKIINWPFELPIPLSISWDILLEKELRKTTPDIIKSAIIPILSILPKNPRKFKHYLRYMNSLHRGFLNRFGKEELDWKMLYLAQLVRMEFPDIFKELIITDEIVNDIASGVLWDKTKDIARNAGGTAKKEEAPEWQEKMLEKIKNIGDIDKDRFFHIYKALRESGGLTTPERVRNHLLVLEVPELMTWKEYRKFKDKLISCDDRNIISKLKRFVSNNKKGNDIERVREFMKMLLRDREEIWGNLIDLHSQDEMKVKLEDVSKIMRICNLLIDIDEIFVGANPVMDKATFEEWFDFLSKWAHFKEHKNLSYSEIRDDEKNLLLKIVNKNLHRASDIAEWLRVKFRGADPAGQFKVLADVKKEINEILWKRLTRDILARLEKTEGIKNFWPRESFVAEKRLLCKDGTLFHTSETYVTLNALAIKAKNNLIIQNNFVEVLRMLFYGTTDYMNWIEPGDVKKLIEKKDFFEIIWNGATFKPLNRRLVGSLEEYIKKLCSVGFEDKYFVRPDWWVALIADKGPDS